MSDYNFSALEQKWQAYWQENQIYKVENDFSKPKYYALDMFPYPSGAGLHVGHPLGYIATDIISRYKRMQGYNVLHPMGFDSFGLPAEQYAIETGQHPAITTEQNIATFKAQLAKIGFNYDWSREVRTSEPTYYRWTQWIFQQLFKSWYNNKTQQAEPIETLVGEFEKNGNTTIDAPCDEDTPAFDAKTWLAYTDDMKQRILLKYRLTYLADAFVNWCPALGSVLANDEVKDGLSERGGHPVERKKMRQWMMRITAYADRLLDGLHDLDWSDAIKEMQRNWIGKSMGCEIRFNLPPAPSILEGESSLLQSNSVLQSKTDNLLQSNSQSELNSQSEFENLPLQNGGGRGEVKNIVHYNIFTNTPERWKVLKEFAKNNRKNLTKAEETLWEEVRKNKLDVKFRKQHVFEDFILDFVSLEKKLVIELDGPVHDVPEQREYDAMRTYLLEQKGFRVIRFSNDEILKELPKVLDMIKEALAGNLPPAPSILEGASSLLQSKSVLQSKTDNLLQSNSQSELNSQSEFENPPLQNGGGRGEVSLVAFTTRIDTIFGVSYLVLAPEHDIIPSLTTEAQKEEVEKYVIWAKNRSERERQAEVKTVSGVFTGSYAVNPFSGEQVPIWVADYVLSGYGTGVVMGVPASDERDFRFATHFGLPIVPIIDRTAMDEAGKVKEAYSEKVGKMINSDFLNGLEVKEAIAKAIEYVVENDLGKAKINFRLRDSVFGRQRYWGEPVPVKYDAHGLPALIDESELPLILPEIDEYKPTTDGEPPLARAKNWQYEASTMPGWAGSSWYFLRYMDNQNSEKLVDLEIAKYWNQVDLYMGGTEHAVGHLLYSRFWNHFLFDRGHIAHREPFKKLINQGMIQGMSSLVYRLEITMMGEGQAPIICISKQYAEKLKEYLSKRKEYMSASDIPDAELDKRYNDYIEASKDSDLKIIYQKVFEILQKHNKLQNSEEFRILHVYESTHVDVNCVENGILDIEKLIEKPPFQHLKASNVYFIKEEDGKFHCGSLVEKMSKRWYNVVNPDDVVGKYGADTMRLYEMFLGPLEMAKPWNTNGIDGTYKFLRKLWRLFYGEHGTWQVSEQTPSPEEYKTLHKCIKKITEDLERFSFNTPVSEFMICVNALQDLKCSKREILQDFLKLLAPFAPHITEELWHALGNAGSIHHAEFPKCHEAYLVENSFEYPIQINGKLRTNLTFPIDMSKEDIEKAVLSNEAVQKYLEGNLPKKVVVVPKKIVNVVI